MKIEKVNNNLLLDLNMEQMGETFIKYLDVDDLTLKAYKVGIGSFLQYLKDNNIAKPTRSDLIVYRDHLRETYSTNTVNSYMTSIRALFKYLEIHGMYENISIDVKGARYDNTPKKQILTIEQMKYIYDNLTDKRERCLWSLLITTGLRGCEVATALIEDIKMYNNEVVLFVLGKKRDSKCEYVKLSDQVIKDIKDYIGERKNGYIFTSTSNNNKGGGVTTKTLRLIVKDIFKRFGYDDETYSLHSTRRSSATAMYELGQSIYDIQQTLHHVSINTTTRYINCISRNKNKSEYIVSNAILG